MERPVRTVSPSDWKNRPLYTNRLPEGAWWSKPFSDFEDERIWSRRWVAIGYGTQLPRAGDILPYTVGNHGIHVERGEDGTLSGYFNFAQHGGCRSIPIQCQTGHKTSCSYLSCGFSRDRVEGFPTTLNRESIRARHFTGFNDAKRLPVRLELCDKVIFVDIDPANEVSWKRPSLSTLDGAADVSKQELSCNWKLLWREVLSEFAPIPGTCGSFLRGQWTGEQTFSLTAILPNFLMLESPRSRLSIIFQPTGTNLTLLRVASWDPHTAQPLIDLVSAYAERVAKQQIQIQRGYFEPRDVTDNLDRELMSWLSEQLGIVRSEATET